MFRFASRYSKGLYWTICLMKRVLVACCKSPVPLESKFSDEMLIELMGDSNHRADVQAASAALKKGGVRYTKGGQDRIGG